MSTPVARWLVLTASALLSSSTGVRARAQAGATSFKVLQPLGEQVQRMTDPVLHREVFYVPTMLEFVRWGKLPNATTPAAVTVPSGSLVTFDIVSHEGVLEDQGRDPVRFFAQFGIPREQVLNDAIRVAASNTPHDFAHDGPHVITASVAVTGAERGDVLRVDVVYSLGLAKPVPLCVFGSSDKAFGTPGFGGSFGFADPDTGTGFAYLMNRLGFHLCSDPRELAVRQALFRDVLGARPQT